MAKRQVASPERAHTPTLPMSLRRKSARTRGPDRAITAVGSTGSPQTPLQRAQGLTLEAEREMRCEMAAHDPGGVWRRPTVQQRMSLAKEAFLDLFLLFPQCSHNAWRALMQLAICLLLILCCTS